MSAEELLQGEGFTDVQEVKASRGSTPCPDSSSWLTGKATSHEPIHRSLVIADRRRRPDRHLDRLHVGCLELFGTDRIRTIRDLKGKTVAVTEIGGPAQLFLASHAVLRRRESTQGHQMGQRIPRRNSMRMLAEGKIDAYMAFPPDPQELGRKRSVTCSLTAPRIARGRSIFAAWWRRTESLSEKIRSRPSGLCGRSSKSANICALEPERSARLLVDKGYTSNYDYALGTLKEIPYGKWREYDPEDTVRFYSLRLHEVGMIKNRARRRSSRRVPIGGF